MNEDQQKTHGTDVATYKAVTKKSRNPVGKYIAGVILLLVACFSAGLAGGYVSSLFNPSVSSTIERNSAGDGNAVVSQDEQNISAVATKVGPSVVSITTEAQTDTFFGSQTLQGAGSGIIISSDGYILTNKHVVSSTSGLSVTASDGTVYDDVKLVGTDPLNDLAFLKLNGVKDLTPAVLGDSSSVRIGQNVVAIGNSLGEYQNTVTSGIISGTGRPVSAQEGNTIETLTDLLQTDAAINPGNSGGPLVNLSGQVIGVNTAIAEDAQSIGFSIPINSAKGLIKNLLETGKVERPYLGVNYLTITPELAKQYSLPVKKGAYVVAENTQSVIPGSPADKAGLKNKDIITKVNDLEVGERGSVASLVAEYSIGETIQLTYIRDGETQTASVKLVAYPQS